MKQKIISVMFVVYLAFLVWAILWKCHFPYVGEIRVINLNPFAANEKLELLFNWVIFIPFGFFLCETGKNPLLALAIVVLASLSLETLQFLLGVGCSDTTDLILNSVGGAIGIICYWLLRLLFRQHTTKIALVISIIITLMIIYAGFSFVFLGHIRIGNMMFSI
ncbi:VanZ family protein [Clostridia bacterium]|nr:VanZ family protein [Clostridia bacterium]